jgi:hypothetical protein
MSPNWLNNELNGEDMNAKLDQYILIWIVLFTLVPIFSVNELKGSNR